LLRTGQLTAKEVDRVAGLHGVSSEDLLHQQLYLEVDILKENIACLLESVPHGSKKQIAVAVGVDQTTISRWLSGKGRPQPVNQRALERLLSLRQGWRIDVTPLFLFDHPITDNDRRNWIHDRVDALSADGLRQLFPALERLLEDRDRP